MAEEERVDPAVRLVALLFISFSLFSTVKPASAEEALRVEVLPGVVRQGEVCFIKASGLPTLKSIHVEFLRKKFPMTIGTGRIPCEGLVGIDLNTRPAIYGIRVIATDESSRVYSRGLLLKVRKADFKTQRLSLPSSMVDLDPETLERVNEESGRLKAVFQGLRNEKFWRGPFIRPVEGELSTRFGLRRIINGQIRSPHTGVDLRAEEGEPIRACNSGIVVLVDQFFFPGISVIVDHGWGLYSSYFHLSEALVREGDRVSTGTMLGRVGSTGRSTGFHLHWGIIINGARVDPLSLIKASKNLR